MDEISFSLPVVLVSFLHTLGLVEDIYWLEVFYYLNALFDCAGEDWIAVLLYYLFINGKNNSKDSI